MENRVLKTELIAWQSLNDLQPKGLKIDTNTAALKTSLQKHGFSLPFYAWRDAKGKIWIIDGHTRKSVLKELISDGVEVPELLPCTFIDAKDKKEAVELLLEVYNQRQNQIDQFVMQVFVEEYDIPIEEVAVESLNVKEYAETENEPDYSLLDDDDENLKRQTEQMTAGVKKAIQIEFEAEHYEDAYALVKFWRERDAYVGGMIMEYLKSEKEKI